MSAWSDFDPLTLAQRGQYVRLPEVHDPADRPVVFVEWEDFPEGTGRVVGRVHDQHGRSLSEFHLNIRTSTGDLQGEGPYKAAWMRIPVMHPEGHFEVDSLAPGAYTITAFPFDYPTHVKQKPTEYGTFTIPNKPNVEVQIDIELEARELRYGRAVFDDGTPVARGGWTRNGRSSLRTDENGFFRACLSKAEQKEMVVSFESAIEVYANGQPGPRGTTRQVVQVPWDALSTDPEEPYVVVVGPNPAIQNGVRPIEDGENLDDPASVLRLKQIGAIVQTRDNGTVRKISFLDGRFDEEELAHLKGVPTLEELSIQRTGISDEALVHVQTLSRLKALDLVGEPITDAGLVNLKGLTRLRSLNLMRTRISDKSLSIVAALPHLEELNLNGTFITNAGLEQLTSLENLKNLWLNDTAIGDDGLSHVARMPQLEKLHLSNLRITDEGLGHIRGLSGLTELNLTNCLVTDEGLAHLAAMRNLRSLRLHDASITDAGVEKLIQFVNLEQLSLSQTKVTDAGLKRLTALKNLQMLYLNPHISDAGLVHLEKFENLRTLGISDNRITDAGMAHVGKLTRLINLHLDNTGITDSGIVNLRDLKDLYFLTVRGTKVTRQGVSQAWKQHPRLQQLFDPE